MASRALIIGGFVLPLWWSATRCHWILELWFPGCYVQRLGQPSSSAALSKPLACESGWWGTGGRCLSPLGRNVVTAADSASDKKRRQTLAGRDTTV